MARVLSVWLRSFVLLFLPDSVAPKSVTQCLVLPVQEVAFLDELRSFELLGRAVSLCT